MATKALLLSGIAAFGIGLVAAAGLFHEPGGERHERRSPPPAAAANLSWDTWQPSAPPPAAAPEPTTDVAVPPPELVPTEADYDPNAVWATTAEWSETD